MQDISLKLRECIEHEMRSCSMDMGALHLYRKRSAAPTALQNSRLGATCAPCEYPFGCDLL